MSGNVNNKSNVMDLTEDKDKPGIWERLMALGAKDRKSEVDVVFSNRKGKKQDPADMEFNYDHPGVMVKRLSDIAGRNNNKELIDLHMSDVFTHMMDMLAHLNYVYGEGHDITPLFFFDMLTTNTDIKKGVVLDMDMYFGYICPKARKVIPFLELHHLEHFDAIKSKVEVTPEINEQFFNNFVWRDCAQTKDSMMFVREHIGNKRYMMDPTNPYLANLVKVFQEVHSIFGKKMLLVGDYLYFDMRWFKQGLLPNDILNTINIEPLDVSSLELWDHLFHSGLVPMTEYELLRPSVSIERTIENLNLRLKEQTILKLDGYDTDDKTDNTNTPATNTASVLPKQSNKIQYTFNSSSPYNQNHYTFKKG